MWTVKNGISELKVKAQPATGSLFRILNIGRMSRAKNQLCLIDALARVEGEFHATIIGDGRLRPQIESRITQLGLSDRVTLAGETDEVASQFASAHLFVLSSDYEGLPLSVLEAMSAGLPVVATDVGGVGEAVESGKTGYLVPRGDSVAMAARITRLLDDPALRLAMGNSGLERYREQFTLPPMVAGTESVYRQLLGD